MYSGHYARAPDSCKVSGRKVTDSTHDGQNTARANKLKEVYSSLSSYARRGVRHPHTQTWSKTQHFDKRALLSGFILTDTKVHNRHEGKHEINHHECLQSDSLIVVTDAYLLRTAGPGLDIDLPSRLIMFLASILS